MIDCARRRIDSGEPQARERHVAVDQRPEVDVVATMGEEVGLLEQPDLARV